MSKNFSFYEFRPITSPLPDVVDLDDPPDGLSADIHYVEQEKAAQWVRKLGTPCVTKRRTLDLFAAAEKIFGERPNSARAGGSYYLNPADKSRVMRFTFEDGSERTATREQLEEYAYDQALASFAILRIPICEVPKYISSAEIPEGVSLSEADIFTSLGTCVEECGSDGDFVSSDTAMAVYNLVVVLLKIRNGSTVVCVCE